MIVMVRNITN